jgi:RNA polymerase sigma factor (sigma-70 family)
MCMMRAVCAESGLLSQGYADGPNATEATGDLLERVRNGDRGALDSLLRRYLTPLRRWASGRLPHWARDMRDTDDLVQDTLVNSLRNLHGFEARHSGALHAYFRQAVSNRIKDELRRAARRGLPVEPGTDLAAIGPSPVEEVIGKEAFARYERSLARLTPAEREAVITRVELGLNHTEAAAALGKSSPDAARVAVARALLKLAEEMARE